MLAAAAAAAAAAAVSKVILVEAVLQLLLSADDIPEIHDRCYCKLPAHAQFRKVYRGRSTPCTDLNRTPENSHL
jgi:hypothetical protein